MINRKLFLILFLNFAVSFGAPWIASAQQVPSATLLDPQAPEKAQPR